MAFVIQYNDGSYQGSKTYTFSFVDDLQQARTFRATGHARNSAGQTLKYIRHHNETRRKEGREPIKSYKVLEVELQIVERE